MTTVQRCFGFHQGVIDADVESVWAEVTDWGQIDWYANDVERDGMHCVESFLEGDPGAVPRTRVMKRSNAVDKGLPLYNRETLLREDPVAHRLYYDADDDFAQGVRNYIASWAFDPLPDGRCRMTISSTFDVFEPVDGKFMKETFEMVYSAITRGLHEHFTRKKSGI